MQFDEEVAVTDNEDESYLAYFANLFDTDSEEIAHVSNDIVSCIVTILSKIQC